MTKISGQELKKDLEATKIKLSNLNNKINRKFDLILNEYSSYIPVNYKTFLENSSVYDLETHTKLDVIIATEDNYVKQNSDQCSLFDDN